MTENKRGEGNYPEIPDSSKMRDGKDEIYADLPDFHGKILMYKSEDNTTRVEAVFSDEDIWMSQRLKRDMPNTLRGSSPPHQRGRGIT